MSPRLTLAGRWALMGALAALFLASVAVAGDGYKYKRKHKHEKMYANGYSSDGFAYIIVRDGGENMSGSGDIGDYNRIRRLTDRYGQRFVWARLDGRTYVIDDDELVQEAIDAVEPVRMLGKAQGKLGAQQGRLGARQGRLGALQGRLGAKQAALAVRQSVLAQKLAILEQRGDDTRDLEREMEEIEALQEELGDEQSRLGDLQSELGEGQGPLGRQQEKLGARQAALSKQLQVDMRRIVDDAIERGLADRLN